jgi:hypothetical protein
MSVCLGIVAFLASLYNIFITSIFYSGYANFLYTDSQVLRPWLLHVYLWVSLPSSEESFVSCTSLAKVSVDVGQYSCYLYSPWDFISYVPESALYSLAELSMIHGAAALPMIL